MKINLRSVHRQVRWFLITFAIVSIVFVLSLNYANASDKGFLIEFGLGFGKSGQQSKSNNKKADFSLCKNLKSGGLKYAGLRLNNDEIELHGARMWHDNKGNSNCDRDSYALGLGYIIKGNRDDNFIAFTPGIAYTWSDNKDFRDQESDGTTWRLHSNVQFFSRLSIGSDKAQVALVRYGSFEPNHGESFVTVALGATNSDDEAVVDVHGEEIVEHVHKGDTYTHTHTDKVEHKHDGYWKYKTKTVKHVHNSHKGKKEIEYHEVTTKKWIKPKIHMHEKEYTEEHTKPDTIHSHVEQTHSVDHGEQPDGSK